MSPYYFIYFTVLPEVVMAATEVESAIFRFMSSLGQGTDWDPEEFDSICEMIPAFKFGILVTGENQRFVSSTGNMEILLSHIRSIVCANTYL